MNDPYSAITLPSGDSILIFTDEDGSAYFCNGREVVDKGKIYELEQVIDGLTSDS